MRPRPPGGTHIPASLPATLPVPRRDRGSRDRRARVARRPGTPAPIGCPARPDSDRTLRPSPPRGTWPLSPRSPLPTAGPQRALPPPAVVLSHASSTPCPNRLLRRRFGLRPQIRSTVRPCGRPVPVCAPEAPPPAGAAMRTPPLRARPGRSRRRYAGRPMRARRTRWRGKPPDPAPGGPQGTGTVRG